MAQTVLYNIQGSPGSPDLPIFASSTPPTQAQAAQTSEIVVQVSVATGDALALITHNWNFSTLQTQYLFRPQIIGPNFITAPVGASFAEPVYTWTWLANALQLNKTTGAGTDGTFVLVLRYPAPQ